MSSNITVSKLIERYTLPVRVLETSLSVLWWPSACNFSVIPWILSTSEDPTWLSVEATPVLLTLLLEVVCDVIAAQAVVEESTAISWEPTNADNTWLLILGASARGHLVYEYLLLSLFIPKARSHNAIRFSTWYYCDCDARLGIALCVSFLFLFLFCGQFLRYLLAVSVIPAIFTNLNMRWYVLWRLYRPLRASSSWRTKGKDVGIIPPAYRPPDTNSGICRNRRNRCPGIAEKELLFSEFFFKE